MPLGCCEYSTFVNVTVMQKYGTIILVVALSEKTMLFLIAPSKAASSTPMHISFHSLSTIPLFSLCSLGR